jgi:vacuolar-type H+-ATPase subunit E/Vma4
MKIDEKLAFFAKLAEQEAQSLRSAIMAEMEEQMGSALADITSDAQRRAKQRVESEKLKIAQMKNKDVVRASIEAKKAAIDLRGKLVGELFEDVLEALLEHVKTESYRTELASEISSLAAKHGGQVKAVLMERDMAAAQSLSCVTCEASSEDFIGGFILVIPERKVMEDHTYLARLKEEKSSFNELKFEGGAVYG